MWEAHLLPPDFSRWLAWCHQPWHRPQNQGQNEKAPPLQWKLTAATKSVSRSLPSLASEKMGSRKWKNTSLVCPHPAGAQDDALPQCPVDASGVGVGELASTPGFLFLQRGRGCKENIFWSQSPSLFFQTQTLLKMRRNKCLFSVMLRSI